MGVWRNGEICVDDVKIVMHGDINVHAQVAVVTKAKLDEITVKGDCKCEDVLPELVELVIVVDGSDSYNDLKIERNSNGRSEGVHFGITNKVINEIVTESSTESVVSVVQFSGLNKAYEPDSNGKIDGVNDNNLVMYRIEVNPTYLDSNSSRQVVKNMDQLDGNGQLFLCLQDLSMKRGKFLKSLERASEGVGARKRKKVLLLFTDGAWDMGKPCLKDYKTGRDTTRESVVEHVHETFDEVYPCIVRNENDRKRDVTFIESMAGKNGRVIDLYADKWNSTSVVTTVMKAIGI